MNIMHDVSLSDHSTMRLGGKAAHLVEIRNTEDVAEATFWAEKHNLPMIMIGDGSNIVWGDKGFNGLVLVNQIKGFDSTSSKDNSVILKVGSGENWDATVERAVAKSLHGIEALSLIPGTAGATPVQNVGAYGQEIADTLVSVEAYDCKQKVLVTIPRSACAFGYRTSRFKTIDKGKFFITQITLELSREKPKPPFYQSLQDYIDKHNISEFTPQTIRKAVIAIRTSKLPDPKKVANNGSFFNNPIIPPAAFERLKATYPGVVSWPTQNGHAKVSAAWLVEHAGFKDIHDSDTGMGTWPGQALVLVNEHARSTADLLRFKRKIVDKVQLLFGITLQQEPELIGEL